MTVQQGAPKIQPQHHYPCGPFSLWKEPPTVSHQCKPFPCFPSVPWGSCRGNSFHRRPRRQHSFPSPCYGGPTQPVGSVWLLGRASVIFLQVELPGHRDLAAWLLSEVLLCLHQHLRNKLQVPCPFPCETGCLSDVSVIMGALMQFGHHGG